MAQRDRRDGGNYPQSASEVASATREIAGEIEAAVREALPRAGVAGAVVVRGTQAELRAKGPPVSVEIDWIVEQWAVLPPEMRQRKAAEVARRLADALRLSGQTEAPEAASGLITRARAAAAGVVVLGVAAAAFGASRAGWLDKEPAGPAVATPAEVDAAAAGRRQKICEASRKNAYSHRPIDAFGTDGWVAELWLARRGTTDLASGPALSALVANGKLAASADDALAGVSGGSVEIAAGFSAESAAKAPGWRAVTVRFGGEYARVFLVDQALRARFLGLADRLASDAQADMGALYGRCEHLPYRDIGAWFRGVDRGAAGAALLYSVGSFTEAPTIDRAKLAGFAPGDLDAFLAAASKVAPAALSASVSGPGGSVAAPAGSGPAVITFPLLGGTGATTASTTLAKEAGIGIAAQ